MLETQIIEVNLIMALTSGFRIIYLIIFLAFASAVVEDGTNITTTEETKTTESNGTITIQAWIIYGVIVPILIVAAIVTLVLICCCLCKNRHKSVLPTPEPKNKRINNNLNNDNEAIAGPFAHFVVSYESKKISKKTKKAVNCLVQKDRTPAMIQNTEPGIEKLNKAIAIATEERERTEENESQADAVSENAFNHMKEESAPSKHIRKKQSHVTTNRSDSLSNTFKIENENSEKVGAARSKTLPHSDKTVSSKRRRKPKESAIKRNMKLIKSRINKAESDSTNEPSDESTDDSALTDDTCSEEESAIDRSFVPSGVEDVITDDEDSGTDYVTFGYPKRHKTDIKTKAFYDEIKEVSNAQVENNDKTREINRNDSPDANMVSQNITRRNAKKSKKSHLTRKDSKLSSRKKKEKHQKKTLKSKVAIPLFTQEPSSGIEFEAGQKSSKASKIKQKNTNPFFENTERQGPLATSSFKSDAEEKSVLYVRENMKTPNDNVNFTTYKNDMKEHNNVGEENNDIQERDIEDKADANFKEFEEMVKSRGKINLNRSVSLNEMDIYKHDIGSRRRKRKYQSLREAKTESVFAVLKTLDKTPKKSILKKSKSLHTKSNDTENLRISKCERNYAEERNAESLPYVHFTENVAVCQSNDCDRNKTSLDLNSTTIDATKSFSVNLSNNKNNKSNGEPSNNVLVVQKRAELQPDSQYIYNKTPKTAIIGPSNWETPIVVVRRMSREENNPDIVDNKHDDSLYIVSSNLQGNAYEFPAQGNEKMLDGEEKIEETLEDEEIGDVSKVSDRISSIISAFRADTSEKLLPESTQLLVHDLKLDSGAEPHIKTSSDVESCDEKEPKTFISHNAPVSYEENNMTTSKISTLKNEEHLVNTSATRTDGGTYLDDEQKSFEDVQNQFKLSSDMNMTLNDVEHFTEESRTSLKKLKDARIYVSERGLLYSKEYETEHYPSASLSPSSAFTDQHTHQESTSSYKSTLNQSVITANSTSDFKETPVVALPMKNLKDDVTESYEVKDAHKLMFIRTHILNDLRTKDSDTMPEETNCLQTGHPETNYADTKLSTSTKQEHEQVFETDEHHTRQPKMELGYTGYGPAHESNRSVQIECSQTPLPTCKGLKLSESSLDGDRIPHQRERPKSNPIFEHINMETSKMKTKSSSDHFHIQNVNSARTNSPIQSINVFPLHHKQAAIAPSVNGLNSSSQRIQKSIATQDMTLVHNLSSPNSSSTEQERPAKGKNETLRRTGNYWTENIKLHKKSSLNDVSSFIKPTTSDVPSTQDNRNKDKTIIGTRIIKEQTLSERTDDLSKTPKRIESISLPELEIPEIEKYNAPNRRMLKSGSIKFRSKTPSVEMERSPRYPTEQKRSKTPLPIPTYNRSNTQTFWKKPVGEELKPRQQTHHIDSLSRNVPLYPVDKRQFTRPDPKMSKSSNSLRNKRSNTIANGKLDANTNALLNRRRKDNNTLSGRENSKKPSERERPKSAMSLRSAPWSTTMETVRTIPRNVETRHERTRTPESFMFYDDWKLKSKTPNPQPSVNIESYMQREERGKFNIKETNWGLSDSDSELEEFFANPDKEVLQLGH